MRKKKKRGKRIRWNPGDVAQIDLRDGSFAFARLLVFPLIAFYDLKCRAVPAIDAIVGAPIMFKLWVMKYAIADGDWPIVGHLPLQPDLLEEPWFYKQDDITGEITLTKGGFEPEVPASLGACDGLECAAVWEPEHVVDRLNDHFAARPNKWVESLRPQAALMRSKHKNVVRSAEKAPVERRSRGEDGEPSK